MLSFFEFLVELNHALIQFLTALLECQDFLCIVIVELLDVSKGCGYRSPGNGAVGLHQLTLCCQHLLFVLDLLDTAVDGSYGFLSSTQTLYQLGRVGMSRGMRHAKNGEMSLASYLHALRVDIRRETCERDDLFASRQLYALRTFHLCTIGEDGDTVDGGSVFLCEYGHTCAKQTCGNKDDSSHNIIILGGK